MRYKPAYKLFEQERERQRALGWDEKHDKTHSVESFILMLEKQLNDLKSAWYTDGDQAALKPLIQIGAVTTACIESQYIDDLNHGND